MLEESIHSIFLISELKQKFFTYSHVKHVCVVSIPDTGIVQSNQTLGSSFSQPVLTLQYNNPECERRTFHGKCLASYALIMKWKLFKQCPW